MWKSYKRWPRLAYNIIEGMLEAGQRKIFPIDLSASHPVFEMSQREALLHFIQQAQGFIPSIFQSYQKQGDRIFNELNQYGRKMMAEELGPKDLQAIVAKYQNGSEHPDQGWEFLLAFIQRFSPTSGASFVKKSEQIGLLKKMVEAGDLRTHIPNAWQQALPPFVLTRGKYRLPTGASADPEGKIKAILTDLRPPQTKDKLPLKALTRALQDYIQAEPEDRLAALSKAREVLYRFAGQADVLGEKVDRIQDNDYSALLILEHIFKDPQNLPQLIKEAMHSLDKDQRRQLLSGKGEKASIQGDGRQIFNRDKKT